MAPIKRGPSKKGKGRAPRIPPTATLATLQETLQEFMATCDRRFGLLEPSSSLAPPPPAEPTTSFADPAPEPVDDDDDDDVSFHPFRGTLMNSVTFPVDAHVSDKIRSKIIKDEFVNFCDLLPPRQAGRETVAPKKLLVVGQDGSVSIQADDPKKLLSWTEWSLAWNVFQLIRNKAGSRGCAGSLLVGLAKHFETTHNLMTAQKDWRWFDSQTRKHLAADPSARWGTLFAQALDEARNPPTTVSLSSPPAPRQHQNQGRSHLNASASSVPYGYCRSFHYFSNCSKPSCSWSHTCFICQGAHSASSCPSYASHPFRPIPVPRGQAPGPSSTPRQQPTQPPPRVPDTKPSSFPAAKPGTK